MSTVDEAYLFAQELLAVAQAGVTSAIGGAIGRAYVSPGIPAIDCETLCVTAVGLNLNLSNAPAPGRRLTVGGRINLLAFVITVARDCIPVTSDQAGFEAPTPAQNDAASQIILQDVWAIWNAIGAQARTPEGLFNGRCSLLYLDNAAALVTSGMTAGWTINLRTEIDGVTA